MGYLGSKKRCTHSAGPTVVFTSNQGFVRVLLDRPEKYDKCE
jgi:hypothetical protein